MATVKMRKSRTPRATTLPKDYVERLRRVAVIGQAFIDGDACEEALRPFARAWTNGDDLDYDFDVSVPIKQTLLRLERTESFPFEAVLWRRRPDDPGKAEVLLAGSLGSPYGRGPMPIFPALREALVRGRLSTGRLSRAQYEKRLTTAYNHVWLADLDSFRRTGRGEIVSVFAPIRNSMDEIVAALELSPAGRDG